MPAGQRRRRLTLQSKTGSVDSESNAINTPTTVGKVWARVRALSARELLMAAQAGETINYQVTIAPYRSDITHNHRLLDGTRVLDIQTVIPNERRTEIDLLCVEVSPAS